MYAGISDILAMSMYFASLREKREGLKEWRGRKRKVRGEEGRERR